MSKDQSLCSLTERFVIKQSGKFIFFLFQDTLTTTAPCVRPDKMSLSKLKQELEERDLSTVGSSADLVSRIESDDRSKKTLKLYCLKQIRSKCI